MTIPLKKLVELFGGRVEGDSSVEITAIAALEQANSSEITFLSSSRLRVQAAQTKAAALILSSDDWDFLRASYHGSFVITDNPYVYFARVASFFVNQNKELLKPGIHPDACISPDAQIATTAMIGPYVTIEAGAVIADQVVIEASCFIGRNATVGASTHFFPRVTFYADCHIGMRGIVHSGAVIGADGFGFAQEKGCWIKIPQTGGVVIGDDVEIGANTTIDRGTFSNTVIEEGVKLDNQIQIAHNCHIGAHTAMAACVGIAGSTKIGRHCMFGGAAMVDGHLIIADHVYVSCGSLVSHSISQPGQYTGFYPLSTHAEWKKSAATVRKLEGLREKIRTLEKMIHSFFNKGNNA